MLRQPVREDYVTAEAEQQSQVMDLMIGADLRNGNEQAVFHNKWPAKSSRPGLVRVQRRLSHGSPLT